MKTSPLYRLGALVLLGVLFTSPRAPAGTTGSLTGTVLDAAKKSPIAGATVIAASPSQVARVTTDSAGRFTFLSLAPDTYTVSAQREGYESLSIAGISVLADQSQVIPIALQPSLK
ncbi:MAG: carboxypeptidase regulatory-like domain-containing protein, partial [Candidatus Eremiobacteraeota bacterium]|nr:carboxypeptidase regulatory-like domain-containing protein [Candidatus Eremiobacteraeota bacterium]